MPGDPFSPFIRASFLALITLLPLDAKIADGASDKLDSIIIDKVDFKQLDLREALKLLSDLSQKDDSAHEGVRLFLEILTDAPVDRPIPKVTIAMENAPLRRVLDRLCNQADLELIEGSTHLIIVHLKPPPEVLAACDRIQHKLQSIIIDRIHLENLDIATAIELLNRIAKQDDPRHVGVRIDYSPPPEDWPSANKNKKVNLELHGAPLGDVLRYVVEMTDREYHIKPDRVVVSIGIDY